MIITDHTKCSASTDIAGATTCGQGDLDHHGFWEHPCWQCTAAAANRWAMHLEQDRIPGLQNRIAKLEEVNQRLTAEIDIAYRSRNAAQERANAATRAAEGYGLDDAVHAAMGALPPAQRVGNGPVSDGMMKDALTAAFAAVFGAAPSRNRHG